jgi:hypothetical protein
MSEEKEENDVIVWRQGYPTACFLDDALRDQVMCSMCLCPCREPVHGNLCAHLACRTCLLRWADQRRSTFRPPTCPSCRRAVNPNLLVTDERVAAQIADADVCCLYQSETDCLWTGTFGVEGGRNLVNHVLHAHAAQQTAEERPFFLTHAAGALAFDLAASIMPVLERESHPLIQMIAGLFENEAGGVAGILARAMLSLMNVDGGEDRIASIVHDMLPAMRGALAGDLQPAHAWIEHQAPQVSARFTSGDYRYFYNSFLFMWVEQALKLLRALAVAPSQSHFFQRLVSQYNAALGYSMSEVLDPETDYARRVRDWMVTFEHTFAPLLPLIEAHDYRAFYASRPGHAWFDAQHMRGVSPEENDGDDNNNNNNNNGDNDVNPLAAASIEEMCENLEQLEDVHLDQDASHWIHWEQAVRHAMLLVQIPETLFRAWATFLGDFWARGGAGQLNMSINQFQPVVGAWFEHVADRQERVSLMDNFSRLMEITLCTWVEAIPPQYIVMLGGMYPILEPYLDARFFPDGLVTCETIVAVVHLVAVRVRAAYRHYDEEEVEEEADAVVADADESKEE